MKNAYVTFQRTVRVENVEGMTDEQIKEAAVDVFNEADMDDFYADESDIIDVKIVDEHGTDDEDIDE